MYCTVCDTEGTRQGKGEVHETGQVSDQQKKKFKEHSEINPFGYI